MFWNVIKLVVLVLLPLGAVSAAFGFWFDNWLERKYPTMNPETRSRIGTVGMLGLATILVLGFFAVMHAMT